MDSLGLTEEYTTHHAEEVLKLFDWTGLEVQFHPVALDRFKELLKDTLRAGKPVPYNAPAAVGDASE